MALCVTQDILAARLGISSQQVIKYEGGSDRMSVGRLIEIARILDVPASYLLGDLADESAVGMDPARAALLEKIDQQYQELGSTIAALRRL